MKPKLLLGLALVLCGVLPVSARLVRSWSDAELMKASDLVVVATPLATKDLDETNSLGWSQSESFRPRFRGVETTFKVFDAVKGMPANDCIILHHYRYEIGWGSLPSGPDLVSFPQGGTNKLVLYLIKDGTSRYAPVTGQADSSLSIRAEEDKLALVLSGGLAAFSSNAADTNSLRVVVNPSKTEVRVQEKFKVALRVENPAATNQTVRVWSCSWDEEWKTSNTNISWIGWDCTRNVTRNVEISHGGAYTNELEMIIAETIPEKTLSFRMGFTPIDSKNTFWSDAVIIGVAPKPATNKDLTKLISDILTECQRIKPGMAREELLKVFTTEGGLSNATHRTYVYHGCRYIKVDVEFTLSDPKQKVIEERPTDTISKVSKPYLDWSIND